ncbi:MAG: deoxyribonuclease IV [Acidobacteriota bacterium]
MAYLGAHLPAAGGPIRAAAAARKLGCEAVQLFLRPPGRWSASSLEADQVQHFRSQTRCPPLQGRCYAHAPYLLNLASERAQLRCQSIMVLVDELQRADALGLAGVVLHPGSAGRGDRHEALIRGRATLAEVLNRAGKGSAAVLLEVTSGAGGHLGSTVPELAALVPRSCSPLPRSVGICLDLAHLWAAGYDLLRGGWERALGEVHEHWLCEAPHVIHANDTPVVCGSRRDRHAPPGEGALGESLFRGLLHDPRISDTPLVIEIPPGKDNHLVAATLERLRSWRGDAVLPTRSRGGGDGARHNDPS